MNPAKATNGSTGIVLSEVCKRYGATVALNGISLSVGSGKVLALFGENGAGKSTLLKILAGVVRADSGRIYVYGELYSPTSPGVALSHGVALVAQELVPCPDLLVAENIVLGNWPRRRGVTDRGAITKRARELCEEFDVSLPLRKRMGEVSVGEMQLVEILRVLNRSPRVLLLDEPTSALNADEGELVLRLIRRISQSGRVVVLVTHRVQEALSVADDVAVLRGGQLVLEVPRQLTDSQQVIEHMLGRSLRPSNAVGCRSTGTDSVMRLEEWRRGGREPLNGVSLIVPSGAIVGVYGVRGSGIGTLAACLSGQMQVDRGRTVVGSLEIERSFGSPRRREVLGVRFIPDDRARNGLALDLRVDTNLMFPKAATTRGVFQHKVKEQSIVLDLLKRYVVVGNAKSAIRHLSGGNQQKVLMASRLEGSYKVLVVHEPTRGVDIGAREVIHGFLREKAQEGVGILLISSDVDEMVEIADRVVVLRGGRVAGELSGSEISVDLILLFATGGASGKEQEEAAVKKTALTGEGLIGG